ncbi:sugar ABC transporter substrate-binding protein [Candidatus Poriferisodalis sp.]|uniref:sugar ABC transporter substrate-binding protein n=1 Tax=Candidatus Poriferisodalis sp. TaxID=3101277 RepID=UPI003B5B4AE8
MRATKMAKMLGLLLAVLLMAAACGDDDAADGADGRADQATSSDGDAEADAEEPATSGDDGADADEPEPEAAGGVIGFAYGLDDAPIYQNVLTPAKAEAERLGFEIVEGAAASNCEAQQADIDNMIASGVDAVVILNLCPGGYDAQIQGAQSAGVAVVTYLWDHPDADGRILLADEVPGELLADAVIDWYDTEFTGAPDEFSWIVHGCSFAPPNIQLRTEIPKERVTEHTGVAPIEIDCAMAPQPALDATLEALQAEPGIDVVLGLIDGSALGSYAAFEQAEGFDRSNVFIAGVDGELPAIELIAAGGGTDGMYTLSAALDLEAVGFAVVRVAQAAITGDTANALFQTRHVPISSDNVEEAAAWFDRVFGAYIN